MDAVLLSGRGGYELGKPEKRIKRLLSRKEGARLDDLLALNATTSHLANGCIVSLDDNGEKKILITADGARWIVETLANSGYDFINVQSPDTGAVKELGLFLLELTGWDFARIY